ncbi:MAG: HAMP domain-containing histidine kinase [Oscillospiraceae bacterium]|nr:HAMP domain-containing histidine kinase [Oscillospiraceae bacterium]
MRTYIIRIIAVTALFALFAAALNISGRKITEDQQSARNIVILRIADEIQGELPLCGYDTAQCADKVFYSRKDEWNALYGCDMSPDEINIILFDEPGNMLFSRSGTQICGLYDDSTLIGIVEYSFDSTVFDRIILLTDIFIAVCAGVFIIWGIWTLKSIILPFNKLAEYPERLSKGQMTEKLPERRGGFFGRYIWGMNMLSDKLESDRSTIRRLSLERERFITSLIHGIKTPAANIKLLSEAISTGLYDPEGRINEKDAELAGRIEKNADEIEQLVTKVMESTTNEIFDYDPQKEPFYRSRLEKFIRDEYTTRLNMTRTPLDIVSEGDLMINSDYDGICRIIRQVMDNAIKYGDGTGINVKMEKTAEGHFVTISNNGEPLPETELPFVWGSMWRGSNAQNIKGSGVGLYESRLIARKLGGDLLMRAGDHSTEVTLFLPLKM